MKILYRFTTLVLCLFALAAQAQTFVHDASKDITFTGGAARGLCLKGDVLYTVTLDATSKESTVYRHDLAAGTGATVIQGFSSGYDVAVGADGTIWVANAKNVTVYNADYTKNRDITIGENVYGVTAGPDGKMYVASMLKVTVIDPANGDSKQVIDKLSADKFRQVQKVAFDSEGTMYICDYNTGAMRVASIDNSTANVDLCIKKVNGVGVYNRLAYMTVLSNGHMVVSVNRNTASEQFFRVYDFQRDGTLDFTYEDKDGYVTNCWGMATDAADNLWVADGNTIKFWGYADSKAPAITDAAISNVTRSTVDFAFRADEKCTLYWLIDADGANVTADRLSQASKIMVIRAGNLVSNTLTAPAGSNLRLYYMAEDAAGNRSAVGSTTTFSTDAELAVQYLIPVSKSETTTVLEFAANGTGKLYYLVKDATATAPTHAELMAGTAVDYTAAGKTQSISMAAAPGSRQTVYAMLVSGNDRSAVTSVTVAPYSDIDLIRRRYFELLTGSGTVDYTDEAMASRYKSLLASFKQAHSKASQYDPDADGLTPLDVNEKNTPNDIMLMRELVGSVLFPLAMAYNIEGPADDPNPDYHNPTTLSEILRLYRYLSVRDFRSGRELHFAGGGIYLRLTGYFYASMLMRTELQRAGMLDEVADMMGWATRWVVPNSLEIDGGESDWSATSKGNTSLSDGVRTIYNNRLMYLLTLADAAADREDKMAYLTTVLDHMYRPHDAWDGFLKPDYTGYHHNGPWGNTYSTNAMGVAAQVSYVLRGTEYAVAQASAEHIARGLKAYADYSARYDINRGLCGRFPNQLRNIPVDLPGFAFIYETLPAGELRTAIGEAFANLYNPGYSLVKSKLINNVACEILFTAGIGSLQLCNDLSGRTTAPDAIELNRTFPFAALQVHRRSDWMATVKGCSKYVWDFETNGAENWYGRNQSFGQLAIYSGKDAEGVVTAEASGTGYSGYDWSHIPGVTAPALSIAEVLADAKAFQWPRFSNEAFASGVTDGLNGVYGYRFTDRSKGNSASSWISRLTARKSYFFCDNVIVALASDIDNTASSYDSHTTLIQNLLPAADTPVCVNGTDITGLNYSNDITDEGPATITDITGNSYYIANAKGLHLQRAEQTSRNDQDKADTRGNYFTAWLNHGSKIADGEYEYAVTVRGGASAPKPDYTVLRKDRVAHIVSFGDRRGVVVFESATETGDALVSSATEPCAVWLTETGDNNVTLSVANPDLGYYPKGNTWGTFPLQCWSIAKDRQFAASEVQPVELTLRGDWVADKPNDKVTVKGYDAATGTTTVVFNGINAESLTVGLRKGTSGIADITAGDGFTVQPVVTDGPLTVTLPADSDISAVTVVDICGRVVSTVPAAGHTALDLDLSAAAPGHYLVAAGPAVRRIIKR